MLNEHSQLKFLWPPTSSHINDNNVYTGRCYTLGIASTLPSQNTLLDCLFLIHLSTILHPWTIHFKTKLRPKWPKKFFSFRTAPPLSQGLDDRLTPYLKVWIRYWFQLHRLSFPYDHEQCISYYRSFILPGLNGKNAWLRPWRFCHPPHARQVVYFCALTQGSSKQYHCPAARKRKADECKVRDKCDQGAKKVRMGVTDLNNKYDGVIDQASGGVTAVIYTLWQSLFRLHPGNGCLTIETR